MIDIHLISVVPELLESCFKHSIIGRAVKNNMAKITMHQLRDYSENNYKQVDDYQYGGGAGMVMMAEPLAKCIDKLSAEKPFDEIIYLTPDGVPATQSIVNNLSLQTRLLIICGHYKGIDQRIRDLFVTKEICIGDFVVTGGELPAAMLIDGIVRLIPGVLGNEESALSDSFQDNLLAPPVYTRPAEFKGLKVPEVLLSGHAANIENWRYEQAEKRTKLIRPDLLKNDEN